MQKILAKRKLNWQQDGNQIALLYLPTQIGSQLIITPNLPPNLSAIGCCNTSKTATQSYSQGINPQKGFRIFRYSDWLSRYSHLKLE